MLRKHGHEKQLRHLVEECCELGAATMQVIDGRDDPQEIVRMRKELIDVEMMIDQVRCMLFDSLVDSHKQEVMAATVAKYELEDCYAGEE